MGQGVSFLGNHPDIHVQEYNYDMALRQTKLNEYAYQNKMDTLFFLQILLISLLILSIFGYGTVVGIFSRALFGYIALLLLLLNIIILGSRMAYTMNQRNGVSWNRRNFVYEAPPPASVPYELPQIPFDLSSIDLSGVNIAGLCKAYKY
jgi:hypothetical protein